MCPPNALGVENSLLQRVHAYLLGKVPDSVGLVVVVVIAVSSVTKLSSALSALSVSVSCSTVSSSRKEVLDPAE